ncbi:ArsS family sensor histidine kinase [Nitratifractor sp.]
MRRHSIFFKLNLLFAVAVGVTLLAAWLMIHQLQIRDRASLMLKSRLLLQELRHGEGIDEAQLKALGLERIRGKRAEELLLRSRVLRHSAMGRRQGRHHTRRALLKHGRELYLLIETPRERVLLHSRHDFTQLYLLPLGLFGLILLLLGFSYWTLRRSLSPMKRLEEDIRRYGEGEALRYAEEFDGGEDELSRIAQAFYDSADRLRRMGEARQLFLRNLLHELNTPVTKGKLLAELSEEPRTRRMLGSIFERLSTLLGELVEVERIAASSEPFREREELSASELLEEACRRLYCRELPPHDLGECRLFADREAMVIVFKNLLDNALKYGRSLRVEVREGRILFLSEGEPLEQALEHYTQPFHQEYGGEKREGFGLGLYIVHEILQRHGMALEYSREGELNRFAVRYGDNPL